MLSGRPQAIAGGHQRLRIRGQHRRHPRLRDEEQAGHQQRAGHRPADLAGTVTRLLGEHGDAVEAEEGQHRHGSGREHQGPGERVRVVQRGQRPPPSTGGHRPQADAEEERQHEQFADQHDPREGGGHPDATRVDQRVDQHEADEPRPDRHGGHGRVHRHRRDQVEQRRYEDVVQHHRPAGQEADRRPDPPADIVVDAAGQRERADHLGVRERREDQCDHADRVRQDDHSAGRGEHRAEDRHRGDRNHEYQPVRQQVPQSQRAAKLLAVAELR
jgi:hypothetical protein